MRFDYKVLTAEMRGNIRDLLTQITESGVDKNAIGLIEYLKSLSLLERWDALVFVIAADLSGYDSEIQAIKKQALLGVITDMLSDTGQVATVIYDRAISETLTEIAGAVAEELRQIELLRYLQNYTNLLLSLRCASIGNFQNPDGKQPGVQYREANFAYLEVGLARIEVASLDLTQVKILDPLINLLKIAATDAIARKSWQIAERFFETLSQNGRTPSGSAKLSEQHLFVLRILYEIFSNESLNNKFGYVDIRIKKIQNQMLQADDETIAAEFARRFMTAMKNDDEPGPSANCLNSAKHKSKGLDLGVEYYSMVKEEGISFFLYKSCKEALVKQLQLEALHFEALSRAIRGLMQPVFFVSLLQAVNVITQIAIKPRSGAGFKYYIELLERFKKPDHPLLLGKNKRSGKDLLTTLEAEADMLDILQQVALDFLGKVKGFFSQHAALIIDGKLVLPKYYLRIMTIINKAGKKAFDTKDFLQLVNKIGNEHDRALALIEAFNDPPVAEIIGHAGAFLFQEVGHLKVSNEQYVANALLTLYSQLASTSSPPVLPLGLAAGAASAIAPTSRFFHSDRPSYVTRALSSPTMGKGLDGINTVKVAYNKFSYDRKKFLCYATCVYRDPYFDIPRLLACFDVVMSPSVCEPSIILQRDIIISELCKKLLLAEIDTPVIIVARIHECVIKLDEKHILTDEYTAATTIIDLDSSGEDGVPYGDALVGEDGEMKRLRVSELTVNYLKMLEVAYNKCSAGAPPELAMAEQEKILKFYGDLLKQHPDLLQYPMTIADFEERKASLSQSILLHDASTVSVLQVL